MLKRLSDLLCCRSATAQGQNVRPKYYLNEKAINRIFEHPDPAVYFNGNRAARWEIAVVEGQKPGKLKTGDYYGYPVDAGTGGFMSLEVAEAYLAEDPMDDDNTTEKLLDLFQQACQSDDYTLPLNHVMNEEGLNIIVFSSGLGDGSYPSYFGYDADGNVCCLVTDFLILDEPAGD